MLVTASRREMPTELAKISSSSQKGLSYPCATATRSIWQYLSERIVAATELMAAVLHRDEDGRLSASYEASKLARPFLCKPARDIVDTMCEMLNEEAESQRY